jgi:hypothetical protein
MLLASVTARFFGRMWRCHDLGVGDSVMQVVESRTLALASALCEFRYANGNTLLLLFSQPEGGKNKKSTRLASLLSTWRGDLDHLY